MDLNLEEKLSKEEVLELKKRVFSFAERMFMEGMGVGQIVMGEEGGFQPEAEDLVKDKISAMTEYFVNDEIWKVQPPSGYNPDPNVDLPQPSNMMRENIEKSMVMAADPGAMVDNIPDQEQDENYEQPPKWADGKHDWKESERPFD